MRAKNELSGATIRFLFLPDPRGLEGLTLFACSKEERGEGPQGRKGHDVSPWGLCGTRSASVNCLPGCSSFPKEGTPVAAAAQATSIERKVVILGYKAGSLWDIKQPFDNTSTLSLSSASEDEGKSTAETNVYSLAEAGGVLTLTSGCLFPKLTGFRFQAHTG